MSQLESENILFSTDGSHLNPLTPTTKTAKVLERLNLAKVERANLKAIDATLSQPLTLESAKEAMKAMHVEIKYLSAENKKMKTSVGDVKDDVSTLKRKAILLDVTIKGPGLERDYLGPNPVIKPADQGAKWTPISIAYSIIKRQNGGHNILLKSYDQEPIERAYFFKSGNDTAIKAIFHRGGEDSFMSEILCPKKDGKMWENTNQIWLNKSLAPKEATQRAMLGFLKERGALNQYLACPEQAILKYRLRNPNGKSPKERTDDERYKKVHSDLQIPNLAKRVLKGSDLNDFYRKFNIKAKPQ